jgi:hypothetical protein
VKEYDCAGSVTSLGPIGGKHRTLRDHRGNILRASDPLLRLHETVADMERILQVVSAFTWILEKALTDL